MSTDYELEQLTAPPPRVKFGPRPDDDMPLSWAERMLTWLKSERPNVFMDGMFAVMGAERKPRR